MIERTVTTVIDEENCTGCGLCVTVCPSETITLVDGKAAVTGRESLNCGHCEAVCPTGAIQVKGIQPLAFDTFTADDGWLPFGSFDTAQLVRLMQSRRSCRNYKDDPVDRKILSDLVKIGVTAPSGTNSQKWTFTVLDERQKVLRFAEKTANFFKRLNKMAGNAIIRRALSLVGKKELESYYQDYYETVSDRLAEWEKTGKDILFHGAPAAIIVGMAPGASCPAEDALLASQNILLGAHSMGLGTCLIGFAVEALKNEPSLKQSLEIPAENHVYAVIAVGYPDEKYKQVTGRKKVTPVFL